MYMVADAVRLLPKSGAKFTPDQDQALKAYRGQLETGGTRFIPGWV